jgi:hypothetical protein
MPDGTFAAGWSSVAPHQEDRAAVVVIRSHGESATPWKRPSAHHLPTVIQKPGSTAKLD